MMKASRRIASIDMLRGLAIVLMTLSAAIGYHSGLPAWMFHCQVPPPDYVFHPEIRGITWVDLAFPFFLFSLGAALPFAMRKRLERGDSLSSISGGIVRRWITLAMFSLLLGNTEAISAFDGSEYIKGVFILLTWAGFFLSLWRTDSKLTCRAGYAILVGLLAFERFYCHVPLDVHHNDIIIMILSSVALTGGFIWLLTRDNLPLRCLIWLLVVAVKAVTSYTDALDFLAVPSCISWLFNWGFLQYLVIVLPASAIGDALLAGGEEAGGKDVLPAGVDGYLTDGTGGEVRTIRAGVRGAIGITAAFAAIPFQLWAMFSRELPTLANAGITLCLAGIYITCSKKNLLSARSLTGLAGFGLLVAGVIFDHIDGGIAKDICNLSYLFTTGGLAALMTCTFLFIEKAGWSGGLLAYNGQNPMIAYTVCWFVISPLLSAIGIEGLLFSLAEGSPFWGVTMGVIVTALTMLATAFFTRKKIFWRS